MAGTEKGVLGSLKTQLSLSGSLHSTLRTRLLAGEQFLTVLGENCLPYRVGISPGD